MLNTLYIPTQSKRRFPQCPARGFRPQIKAALKNRKDKRPSGLQRDRVYDVLEKYGAFAVGEFQQVISLANKRFVILYIILYYYARIRIIATISNAVTTARPRAMINARARSRWRHNFLRARKFLARPPFSGPRTYTRE